MHEVTGRQLELHWHLCLNPHIMNETTVTSSSRIVPLTSTIGLRTLGEEDLFAYLCVHGALHWWYQLHWLADIAALLSASPEGSAERLYREASTRGTGRAAAQALLLCRDVLHTPLPSDLILELGRTPRVQWLQRTALYAMTSERRPLDVRFGTLRGSLSALLLGESWHYRFTELRNLLTNQTTCRYFHCQNGSGFSIQSCGCPFGFGGTLSVGDHCRSELRRIPPNNQFDGLAKCSQIRNPSSFLQKKVGRVRRQMGILEPDECRTPNELATADNEKRI